MICKNEETFQQYKRYRRYQMADIKTLKVVLIKSKCQRVGGESVSKRLIKSLGVRVYNTVAVYDQQNIPEKILIHVEIWEPLIPKKWSYYQKKIFYKDALLAVVIGSAKVFGNRGIVENLNNNTDDAMFHLGKNNVIVLGDSSMGGGVKRDYDGIDGHVGENGQNVLEQITDIAIKKYFDDVYV